MQLIADEVEEQGPDAVEDSAVEAAVEKWDPVVTNLETVQAVRTFLFAIVIYICNISCLFTYSFYIFSGEEIEDVGQDRDSNKPTFATRGRGSNRRYRARFIRRAGGGRFQNYKDGGDRDVSIFFVKMNFNFCSISIRFR